MSWRIAMRAIATRVALMASREDHCLLDLLWRNRRGELDMDVICVISNHEDVRGEVEALGVPFIHIPVTQRHQARGRAAGAGRARWAAPSWSCSRATCRSYPATSCARVGCPVINIHHSFLPAFAGAEPYLHAYERGVKLIGATAHYVTEELDEGPIIEQDVQRVGHATRSTISSVSDATSSAWCSRARFAASSTTACSCTRVARSCSERRGRRRGYSSSRATSGRRTGSPRRRTTTSTCAPIRSATISRWMSSTPSHARLRRVRRSGPRRAGRPAAAGLSAVTSITSTPVA